MKDKLKLEDMCEIRWPTKPANPPSHRDIRGDYEKAYPREERKQYFELRYNPWKYGKHY